MRSDRRRARTLIWSPVTDLSEMRAISTSSRPIRGRYSPPISAGWMRPHIRRSSGVSSGAANSGGQLPALGGELAGEVPPRLPLDVRGECQVQVPQGEVTRGGEVEVDAFDLGNVRFLVHHRLQGQAPPFSGVV